MIIGKREVIDLVTVALLVEGHILFEDVPGTGKTMLARAFATSLGGSFKRIQFTPDLLPNDVTGVSVFNQKTQEFEFRPGPAFSNLLLADEVNRATPRTQSALLESMGERQVTVDGESRLLPRPFLVMATQNPIEYEGTFPLPEAQLDRFRCACAWATPTWRTSGASWTPCAASTPSSSLQQVVQTGGAARAPAAGVADPRRGQRAGLHPGRGAGHPRAPGRDPGRLHPRGPGPVQGGPGGRRPCRSGTTSSRTTSSAWPSPPWPTA